MPTHVPQQARTDVCRARQFAEEPGTPEVLAPMSTRTWSRDVERLYWPGEDHPRTYTSEHVDDCGTHEGFMCTCWRVVSTPGNSRESEDR
jgi:hypothetical protein